MLSIRTEWMTSELNKSWNHSKSVTLASTTIKIDTNRIMAIKFFNEPEIVKELYTVDAINDSYKEYDQASQRLQNQVFFDISFSEANIFYDKSFRFKPLYAEIASFGGLMNFFIRISVVFLGGLTGFA
jgi:hypothetical protein